MSRINQEFKNANVRILMGIYRGYDGFVIKTDNVSQNGALVLVEIPDANHNRVQFNPDDLEITGYYA